MLKQETNHALEFCEQKHQNNKEGEVLFFCDGVVEDGWGCLSVEFLFQNDKREENGRWRTTQEEAYTVEGVQSEKNMMMGLFRSF